MSRQELQRDVIYELTGFTRKLRARFDAIVAEKGLTLARARLLHSVSQTDAMTQRELAAVLDIETPTLVRLLDSMEQQGLIERRICETDRRIKQISLTEDGMVSAAKTNVLIADFRADMMRELSDKELATLRRLTQRMTAGLLAASGEGRDHGE
ncbi:MarR family winged helix-turn-helix transcriptional regulator [Rhizobium halophytocola]|uniref:MarR family transcriptional regulator for hemolysin n=1 Tax=Rhizobium halophytocola TaxID=735519 RepID=A0ABS4DYJ9_9HYPH|nr:MarR family transcriptional regulator [Rhizobium halophytocola]MBP1850768.1 MarR family transcriptional regulator for hemolysin [Rhizobium halophytocola]